MGKEIPSNLKKFVPSFFMIKSNPGDDVQWDQMISFRIPHKKLSFIIR